MDYVWINKWLISAVNCELSYNIQVFNHICEFLEVDLSIKVFICSDDGSVNELLELNVIQVITNHHFEDCEQLTIWNKTVIVDVIDLECKSKLVLLRRSCWKWI